MQGKIIKKVEIYYFSAYKETYIVGSDGITEIIMFNKMITIIYGVNREETFCNIPFKCFYYIN